MTDLDGRARRLRMSMLAAIFTLAVTTPAFAQQSAAPAVDPADLQRRIEKLEAENSTNVEALKTSSQSLKTINESHQSFMTNFGSAFIGLISVLIAIQSLSLWSQARREKESRQGRMQWELDDRKYQEQQRREDLADRAHARDVAGVRHDAEQQATVQVREIFTLVRETLNTRLTAEKEALDRAREAETKYENLQSRFSDVEQFLAKFRTTIESSRASIEAQANDLAVTARHDFRSKTRTLAAFADRFDRFKVDYEPFEVSGRTWSARVLYVRGIAAHYANQPDLAIPCLDRVTTTTKGDPDESPSIVNKRASIAQYFLGIIHSNFGNYAEAIENLSLSIKGDAAEKDFLSRVALAETNALAGDSGQAKLLLDRLIARIDEKERTDKALPEFENRLRSRAQLVHVNILIQERPPGWNEAGLALLRQIRQTDPHYYYATATDGQLRQSMANESAAEAFRGAYIEIRRRGDLLTVAETRSRILLLLTAGICARFAEDDGTSRANEHLDEAQRLLGELPILTNKTCRVFSALTKRNETADTIGLHIRLIRKGTVLWHENGTASA